ncbi:helix-turn-helix domain-containing protein [Mycolicibacterium sp. BK607]|uniref:helix-turn-helix domain-containing protein n=1 Tax=Mycolicibacterium sp. BK607 TaxID=2587098 RepID=UPI001C840FDA
MRVLHAYCNHEAAAHRLEKIIAKAQNGDRTPRTTPLPRPAKQLRPDDVGQILTAWHDGNNVAAITRLLGWDYTTIRKYLRAAGIDTRTNPAPNQRVREILRLDREGKTSRQIAKEVGCSHSTVSVVIQKYRRVQAAES